MRPAVLLLLAVMLLILAGIMKWANVSKPPAPKAVAKPILIKKNGAVAIPSNYSWDHVSERELREFAALFENKKRLESFQVEGDFKSGETIVADIYEARPGEFVFTRLTPRLKTRPDGLTMVEVNVDSFSVSSSGETKTVISHTHELEPRGSLTTGRYFAEGLYEVTLSVDGKENASSIHIKAVGKFHESSSP